MSKLFKLKEWMPLEEAAEHLSNVLNESIQEKDILRLALDGHLSLSANFVNKTQGRLGRVIGADEVEYLEFQPAKLGSPFYDLLPENIRDKPIKTPKDLCIGENSYIKLEKKITTICGVWDLMMLGGEKLDVEHQYQSLIGGPEITLESMEGSFVRRDEMVCQLMLSFDNNEYQLGSAAQREKIEKQILDEKLSSEEIDKIWEEYKNNREKYLENRKKRPLEEDYFPNGALPQDAPLVVRTSAIIDFLSLMNESIDINNQKLNTKEKYTYLILIAALCKQANIDVTKRGIATAISAMTEQIGAPITDDTVRKILKEIGNALDARSKN